MHDDTADDFPDPIATRLTLADGQFVDIRQRLTHGETDDMYDVIYPHGLMNRRVVRTAKIDAYLLGWSLTKKGVPVPMSPDLDAQTRLDTIRSLDPTRALEIYQAIEAHETAMDAKKKIPPGAPAAGAISPSPSGAAGASVSAPSAPSTSTTTSS